MIIYITPQHTYTPTPRAYLATADCGGLHRADKLDGSFSRSRSSSISSLENISSEAIQCLSFADSYVKKNGKQYLITSAIILCINDYQSCRRMCVNFHYFSRHVNFVEIFSNHNIVLKYHHVLFSLLI